MDNLNLSEAICFRPWGSAAARQCSCPSPTLQAVSLWSPYVQSLNISNHKKAWPPSQSQGLESGWGVVRFLFPWVLYFLGGPEPELQGWGQEGGEGRQKLPRAIRKL